MAQELEQRLASKIERTPGGCWLWTSALDAGGYPIYWINGRRRGARAHRLIYERLVGPIPNGLQLDHLCRVRHCVNPEHLEPVTGAENVHRSPDVIWKRRAAQTHCGRGHEFTEANTATHHGRRECRACNAQRARERRAR